MQIVAIRDRSASTTPSFSYGVYVPLDVLPQSRAARIAYRASLDLSGEQHVHLRDVLADEATLALPPGTERQATLRAADDLAQELRSTILRFAFPELQALATVPQTLDTAEELSSRRILLEGASLVGGFQHLSKTPTLRTAEGLRLRIIRADDREPLWRRAVALRKASYRRASAA